MAGNTSSLYSALLERAVQTTVLVPLELELFLMVYSPKMFNACNDIHKENSHIYIYMNFMNIYILYTYTGQHVACIEYCSRHWCCQESDKYIGNIVSTIHLAITWVLVQPITLPNLPAAITLFMHT